MYRSGNRNGVTILRQSRRLYGCWPLKGAFSQPVESKSNRKSKNAEMQNQGILPELSNLDGLPGRAGGLPNGFIPKCRRKVLYEGLRPHLGEVFKRFAEQKECRIEVGHLLLDHVHILISIPPKYSSAR